MRGNWWIGAIIILAVMTLVNGAGVPAPQSEIQKIQHPEARKLPPVRIDLSHFGLGFAVAEIWP